LRVDLNYHTEETSEEKKRGLKLENRSKKSLTKKINKANIEDILQENQSKLKPYFNS
jgi:hypothetical protein